MIGQQPGKRLTANQELTPRLAEALCKASFQDFSRTTAFLCTFGITALALALTSQKQPAKLHLGQESRTLAVAPWKSLLKHPKIKALCPGKQLIVLGSALWDVKHDSICNCNTVKTEPRGVLKHFFLVCTVQVIQNLSMSLPYSRKALRSDADCGVVSSFLVDSASTSYPLADRLSLLQRSKPLWLLDEQHWSHVLREQLWLSPGQHKLRVQLAGEIVEGYTSEAQRHPAPERSKCHKDKDFKRVL